MVRDSMVFYRSFHEATKGLPAEQYKAALTAILEYALNGTTPADSDGISYTVYCMAKPQIDSNNVKYQNGTKGGRKKTESEPKQNRDGTKQEPSDNQDETETEPNDNRSETETEPNVYVYEYDNEKNIDSIPEGMLSEKPEAFSAQFASIRELYNSVCGSYPRLVKLSEARKKAIKARFRSGYTVEDFKRLFELAESSDFLKGKNNRNWSATFDWLIADSNMAKVLDGNYNNRREVTSGECGGPTADYYRQLIGDGDGQDDRPDR